MEFLDEAYPEHPLLPVDARERAQARLEVHRFDDDLGDDYYAFRRGDANSLADRLASSNSAGASTRTSRTCRG